MIVFDFVTYIRNSIFHNPDGTHHDSGYPESIGPGTDGGSKRSSLELDSG